MALAHPSPHQCHYRGAHPEHGNECHRVDVEGEVGGGQFIGADLAEQQQEDGESGHVHQGHHTVGNTVLDEAAEKFAVETPVGQQPKFLHRFGPQQHDGVESHRGELGRHGCDGGSGDAPSGHRAGAEDEQIVEADVQQRRGDIDPHHHGGASAAGEETREGSAEQKGKTAQAEDTEVTHLLELDFWIVIAPRENRPGQRGE